MTDTVYCKLSNKKRWLRWLTSRFVLPGVGGERGEGGGSERLEVCVGGGWTVGS